jgi:hypothetical protein
LSFIDLYRREAKGSTHFEFLAAWNCLIDQIIELVSGTYLKFPVFALNTGELTSGDTGMIISTLFAIDFALN